MKALGVDRRLWALGAGLVLAVPALWGCDRQPLAGHPAEDSGPAYLAPPGLDAASRLGAGGVHLIGHAPANSVVRLRAPEGGQATVRAGGDGVWTLDLTVADAPRLFAFEAEVAGRPVRGEGALAVMPGPGPVALVLRAGFAAIAAGQGAPGQLQLVDLEFNGGGAAAGGFAPPNSPVRLTVDGAVVGVAQADAKGRFAILAIDPRRGMSVGHHKVRLETRNGLTVEREVDVAVPTPPTDRAFGATRAADGWAVSWRVPGGGAQTSLIFDDAVSAPTEAGANP